MDEFHYIVNILQKECDDYSQNIHTSFTLVFSRVIYLLFYHDYCKDQRNAAVIILRYTMDYEK